MMSVDLIKMNMKLFIKLSALLCYLWITMVVVASLVSEILLLFVFFFLILLSNHGLYNSWGQII